MPVESCTASAGENCTPGWGGRALGGDGLRTTGPAFGRTLVGLGVEGLPELGVMSHPIAVAPDVDDVAVMDKAVDQRTRHDVVTEDLAPLLEALVRREHGGGMLVAATHELKEVH